MNQKNISLNNRNHLNYIENIFQKKNMKIIVTIISYLDFDEIINLRLSNKLLNSILKNKKIIKHYSKLGCINSKTRLLFLQSNININKLLSTVKNELIQYKIDKNPYESILHLSENEKEKNKRLKQFCEEIERDITRTFYTKKFLEGNGNEQLKNILTAMAFIRPEIGYCQGMNFIVGALINFIDSEKISFWIFLSFIDDLELNLLFLKNMPDYSIRIYQLNYYIKKYFPELDNHLKKVQIHPDLFFSKWILTIFSSYLPFNILYKVWDVFIIDKWKAIFKFSLIFLYLMQKDLLKMDLNSFSKYLRTKKQQVDDVDFKDIIKHYNNFKVTNKKLFELREDFFIDQVLEKLNDPNYRWETDQNECINSYRRDVKISEDEINKKTSFIQNKIEKLNKEYELAEKAYENELNIVNKIKLKIEVLIEMKNGYENVLGNVCKNHNFIQKSYNIEKKMDFSEENNSNSQGENKNNLTPKIKKGNKILNMIKGFKKEKTEEEKIEKKLNRTNKDLESLNKQLMENYKLLDKKKYHAEKINKERNKFKKELSNYLEECEKEKKLLLKNLSKKLKLSIKFVSTNQY